MKRDRVERIRITDPPEYRAYVLAELRLALKRAQLLAAEIETIGIAVKGHLIDPDSGLAWLASAGALDFVKPTAPLYAADDSDHNTGTENVSGEED